MFAEPSGARAGRAMVWTGGRGSFSSHLQIEGENRSRPQAAKQVCEKWTLTFTGALAAAREFFPFRWKQEPPGHPYLPTAL